MELSWRLCLCVLAVTQVTRAANILYVSATTSPSHHIWDKTLAMALRDRHHNITFFTHSPEKSVENFTTIILEGVYEKMKQTLPLNTFFDLNYKGECDSVYAWMHEQNIYDIETEGLQTMIKQAEDGVQYDLIIWDMTTGQAMYPLIEKFNFPPVIATSPFGLMPYFTYLFGMDFNPSYAPLWALYLTDQMSLLERMQNLLYSIYFLYTRQYVFMPEARRMAEKAFGTNITSFDRIERHTSILLTNSDPILDYPLSVPPAIVHVGGLHINRRKEMTEELRLFLDKAKHGVILLSFGTNIHMNDLGTSQIQALIKAFSRLKQDVLWKCDMEIEDLPKNVHIKKWLPQNDILAHPNLKLFITHGGALSFQEAVYHGVPIVGIPFFVDQHVNVHKLVSRKLGKRIEAKTLSADLLFETITEVLSNPVYKDNMKIYSKRFRDQPQSPLDRAVFWVEYTLRNDGAQHLRLAARDMSTVQLHLLDIWAIILAGLLGVSVLVIWIINNRRCKSSNVKTKIH